LSELPKILVRSEAEGHTIFTKGSYNLNLIGVRTASRTANTFDDEMHVVFKDDFGNWHDFAFRCTTDPGTYYLNNPMNSQGTAIVKAGQYRSVWKVDLHRGKYEALCQRGNKISVYRDSDRDAVLEMDENSVYDGWFGINLHKAGDNSTQVDKWSAGCQVIAADADFDILMALIFKSVEKYGDGFSYTLLED
jgi:hypothetical protein